VSIRFGVSPIAWINDDMPELGGDTPLERVFT
jgi:inosose dehydratase